MAAETFCELVNELLERAIERNEIQHNLWLVPAPLCAMRNTNDARYFPGVTTLNLKDYRNKQRITGCFCSRNLRHCLKNFVVWELVVLKH